MVPEVTRKQCSFVNKKAVRIRKHQLRQPAPKHLGLNNSAALSPQTDSSEFRLDVDGRCIELRFGY
jgi:hypothetical protein